MDNTTRIPGIMKAAMLIAIIGALNWGLVGFFNWNLVDAIFGGGAQEATSTLSRVIYAIVGLAGLGALPLLARSNNSTTTRAQRMDPIPHSR